MTLALFMKLEIFKKQKGAISIRQKSFCFKKDLKKLKNQ